MVDVDLGHGRSGWFLGLFQLDAVEDIDFAGLRQIHINTNIYTSIFEFTYRQINAHYRIRWVWVGATRSGLVKQQ